VACKEQAFDVRLSKLGNIMSAHTYKIIELVGASTEGTDQAIRDAIGKAALTVKHMDWYEVVESRGHIADGKVSHYQVTIKVGFRLE
jgi:flavin-binding protein dodecin